MDKHSLARSLKEYSLVKGMPDEHVEFLSGCTKNVRIDAGKFLFREGKAAEQLYLVRQGKLAIEVHDGSRGTIVIETIGADDALGFAALNPPFRWGADARAVEPTLVFAVDATCLRKKLDADDQFGHFFTRRLMNEIHERLERVRLQLLDVYRPRT
jgi:CRP/FNR family transcriptional regulator, cyclic AMP receptor protein